MKCGYKHRPSTFRVTSVTVNQRVGAQFQKCITNTLPVSSESKNPVPYLVQSQASSKSGHVKKRTETDADKESPRAPVSPFVTLFSEREEVSQLQCFLNTITPDYRGAGRQTEQHGSIFTRHALRNFLCKQQRLLSPSGVCLKPLLLVTCPLF